MAVAGVLALSGLSVSSAKADDPVFSNMRVATGGFVSIRPVYEGSNKFRVTGIPVVYPRFGNGEPSRLEFRGVDDIRYKAIRNAGFQVGPLVGYRFGRKQSDAAELGGLGNVGSGVVVGGFAKYGFGGGFADIALSKQVSGLSDSGFTARFGVGYEAQITQKLTGRIYASGTFASNDYMDRYFSVSAAQSAASVSNYRMFDAGAGVKNVDLTTSLNFQATDRVSLRASAGYSRIVGDTAKSPISISDNQFSGGLGLIFTF